MSPFTKGGKPGPGRPRKDAFNDQRRKTEDTIRNAIAMLEHARLELDIGHPSIKTIIAADSIDVAMLTLRTLLPKPKPSR